jgi:glycerol kinase
MLILALDQGTTSSRALLVDGDGRIVASAARAVTQHYPAPGWVEHDPRELWESLRAAAGEALAVAGADRREIAAIGITNQRETVILWDRVTGEPVANAIVWQDRRTAPMLERLSASPNAAIIRHRTGLVIDPYFSAAKIAWLLDQHRHARRGAEQGRIVAGTVDSWLVWCLTGGREHLTDASNASRTMLYDTRRGVWDEDLCAVFGVPLAMLPRIVDSSGVVAHATGDFAGIPIAGIAGDQQAALFGQGCHTAGAAKNTYGTGCFLLWHAGSTMPEPSERLVSTVAWQIAGEREYAIEGSVFTAGGVVSWLRDGLGVIDTTSDIEALAASVDSTGGVVFVPAFTGLGAPWWDPYARGLVIGLTRGSTAAHLARAALEAIALQTADLVDAISDATGTRLGLLRVDGGASVNDLLMAIQADVLGVPVVRSQTAETTALGAAFLAGLAVGVWPDRSATAALWRSDRQFRPTMTSTDRDAMRTAWRRAVERARGWASDA